MYPDGDPGAIRVVHALVKGCGVAALKGVDERDGGFFGSRSHREPVVERVGGRVVADY